MIGQVINFMEVLESRDRAYWDSQARALGFANFAALESANMADFDAQFDWLQANCSHADKHPGLGMCESCAEQLQA